MRKLLILRGPPGAGKSTLINQLGLSEYALSSDAIRLVLGAPELTPAGNITVSQTQNDRVFALFNQWMEERMGRGETLVLDAMFTRARDLNEPLELAGQYGYQVRVLDLSTVPAARVRAQNAGRTETRRLNDYRMEEMLEDFRQPYSPKASVIAWSDDGAHLDAVREFLAVPVRDLTHAQAVIFIGDLQGCLSPLIAPGGVLENGFDPDIHYIFMGDFFDRGPENAQVMRFLLDQAVDRRNVDFIFGNHETHPMRWSRGMKAVSEEFATRTLPQFLAAGITPDDARRLVDRCVDAMIVRYGDKQVLVTHAGLPTVPAELHLLSTHQLTHGTGFWEDPIDAQFERQAPPGWWQVHGHRNHGGQKVIASANSINLEDSVEHGGCLRAARLDASGWTPIEMRNTVFLPWRDRLRRRKEWSPPWMSEPSNTRLPEATLSLMREHAGVLEKASQSYPHVASLNFTRQVFFDKGWDDVVVKARGLFFDKDTLEVVSRGYDKFFNIGERSDTTLDALAQTLVFPVTLFVKENGYLGNIGFDARRDELFVATKSTPDGEFSGWFREILDATTTPDVREKLRRFLRDMEACMTFEVIDPVRDPHMIEYAQSKLILLDVFHRASDNRRLSYDDLVRVGDKFGLPIKRRGIQFNDMKSLRGFLAAAEDNLAYRYRGEDIEGFVIEDKAGFMTKLKLPHYAFWKRMRSTKDRIVRLRDQVDEFKARPNPQRAAQAVEEAEHRLELTARRDDHPLAQAFARWCLDQPVATLKQDIIALRKQFQSEVADDPTWWSTPWKAFGEDGAPAQTPVKKAPRVPR